MQIRLPVQPAVMPPPLALTLFILITCCLCYEGSGLRRLNIALHGQLHPKADKVVGSVITTNGLRDAFQDRPEVGQVRIFYPSHYEGFHNATWHFVLIEGWFPSIHTFIGIARNRNPQCKIVFICLDPTYPGLSQVSNFAVDAIVTNSKQLQWQFASKLPTEFMHLAADTEAMRPFGNITREWGAIYVGAGGPMLTVKPELRNLLLEAVPFGLRLHGSGWDTTPGFDGIGLGPLPELDLAPAYSSAEVVLASTIQSQREYGMVNNRIFEALACGALVITADAPELRALGCAAILFVNATHSVAYYLNYLRTYPDEARALRIAAREFVLRRHTWDHRAVQLLDFYHTLPEAALSPGYAPTLPNDEGHGGVCGALRCASANCPSLLWLFSDGLRLHPDYTFVVRSVATLHLCSTFRVEELPHARDAFAADYRERLTAFDVVVAVVLPFDALDLHMRQLGLVTRPDTFPGNGPLVQKHAAYLLGYDAQLVVDYLASNSQADSGAEASFAHYDAVWYRSDYDIALLRQLGSTLAAPERWQHVFGIGVDQAEDSAQTRQKGRKATTGRIASVCYYSEARYCTTSTRTGLLKQARSRYFSGDDQEATYMLLLVGGSWNDWLDGVGVDGTSLVPQEVLQRTVHVRDGQVGDAVALVQDAEVVVILGAPPRSGSVPARGGGRGPLQLCSTAAESLPGADGSRLALSAAECQLTHGANTSEDVLWPVVAAAVAGRRIHLQHLGAHIAHIVSSEAFEFHSTDGFVNNLVKVGCDRLLGLGSRHSGFTVRPLSPSLNSEHGSFVSSFLASHEFEVGLTGMQAKQAAPHALTWLELSYEHFQVGRDGEACLEQRSTHATPDTVKQDPAHRRGGNFPGEKVCLMRPYRYLALHFVHVPGGGCADGDGEGDGDGGDGDGRSLSFFLRGAFYGDPFRSFALPLNSLTALPDATTQVPVKWNASWLAREQAFVYNVRIC